MIFQIELTRLFIILIPQLITAFIYLFIIYKVLKRRKDRSSVIISFFYLSWGLAFIINSLKLFLILFESELNIILIFDYLTFYFIIFGFIYIEIFVMIIHQSVIRLSLKRITSIIVLYAMICTLILFIPNGITIDPDQGYRIKYSLAFLITNYLFFTSIIVIPTFTFFSQTYKTIKTPILRKRFKYLIIGIVLAFLDIYGAALYNTWHNETFRVIWSVVTLFLLVPSAILIYLGIGKNLGIRKQLKY